MLCGVAECTVLVQVGIEVIRTALVGIVGQIQDWNRGRGTAVVALVAVGE